MKSVCTAISAVLITDGSEVQEETGLTLASLVQRWCMSCALKLAIESVIHLCKWGIASLMVA